jgi:trehalose-6-phosphatase
VKCGSDRPVVDFVLCAGDDRADEGMFDALGDETKLALMNLASIVTRVFTCRVGSGATSAAAVLESPQKVIELLEEICRRSEEAAAADDDQVSDLWTSSDGVNVIGPRSQTHPGSW